ncbi:MAG: hypothetical protein HUU35_02105, partial [Armatimonadetes bacterium]|nr:hypothetical protein [Armatimonadota bacterium]
SVAPGYVQELVERLYKAYRPRRTGLLGRITERGVAAARPEPRQSGEAPAGDDDPEESEPPDVTDDLKLKKPPATPTWNELDALKKGDLAAGEAPSGETSEDGKSDDDDDDDEPLARPVSVWTVNETDDFAAGRFEGTFLGSDGTVGLAPKVRSLGKPEAERLWSALPMPDGSVFVGSWSSEARVYRVTEGKTELWLETDDVGLVAMAPLPDGSLVVGGIPSGRLYRVTGAGKYTVWADLDELYIWELLPDGKGGLYAATGNHGRVYHLDAAGKATVVLQSSERHVLSLASAGNGLYAGTYPLGKVYRIDAEGVETVFETPAGAVLSLVAMPNGNLYVGEAGSGKIHLVEPDGHTREVAGAEEANTFALTLVDDSVYAATGRPGRLLRIQGDVTAQLYESDEPFLLDLAAASDSSLVGIVAGSGEVLRLGLNDSTRGVYTSPVKDAEMRARWGVLRWRSDCGAGSAVTVETRSGNTSIPDSAWSPWSPTLVESGGSAVTSPPARYIQFRAIFDGGPGLTCRLDRLDLLYRTLNRPPVLNLKSPEAGSVVSKKVEVEWEAEDPDEDELHFDVFYAPVGSDEWQKIEAADEDEDESDDEGEAATDDEEGGEEEPADSDDASDDDDAAATTTAKASGAAPWAARGLLAVHQRPAQAEAAKEAEPVKSAKEADAKEEATPNGDDEAEAGEADEEEADKEERLVEDSITWDTSKLPDGLYRIRVLAHDEKRNPDDPKTVERISKPFRVDNSGPYLEPAAVADQAPPAELLVVEEATWLSSAEYRFDDDEWRAIVPADGIFDSRRETLRRPDLPTEAGEHSFVLRVRDAAGNLSRFEWRFTVAATEDQADE